MANEVEQAFRAGWMTHLMQQTPGGDSLDIDDAWARYSRQRCACENPTLDDEGICYDCRIGRGLPQRTVLGRLRLGSQ